MRLSISTLTVVVAIVGHLCATGMSDDFVPVNTQPNGEQPLAPDKAIEHLSVPDGFQITLAAAEPDVQQPIAIAFDDRGRLWVAESYSYNGSTFTDETHDRILIFEDSDGDGVLDRRKVFIDGLTHLTGLQLGFRGVWISAPPHVAFIPDQNGDDVPDGPTVVHLDGWSLKAEHNSVNGLTWGPDGWLYGRHGIKQPSFVGKPGTPDSQRIELSCCIWRYHPTRHDFQVVADGTINPWGLDFDDHGQGFLTTSVVDHLWHLVPGAHYERWKGRGVHPNPVVYEAMTSTSDHLHWSDGTTAKANRNENGDFDFGGGHSHCDAMIYLGDRWPDAYRGTLFSSNIHGRRINRDRLEAIEGEYRGVHDSDFLLSSDPWFRAVSLEYGPDGDVMMTDWSDNGECHDRDGIHRTSGRIYKISWGAPRLVSVDLAAESSMQLVEYQLHRNEWYVRTARRLLQERAAAGEDVEAVRARLGVIFDEHPDADRKLRAMWTLYAVNAIDEPWLIKQLSHSNEHIRVWAIRLLIDRAEISKEAVAEMTKMVAIEPTWLVRMTLAATLQKISVGNRTQLALKLAESSAKDTSDNLQRMIWYGIEPVVIDESARVLESLESISPRLRLWIARRITESGWDNIGPLFTKLERMESSSMMADILDGFNDANVASQISMNSTSALLSRLMDHSDSRLRIAATTAAARVGDESILWRLRSLLLDSNIDERTRLAALTGLVSRKPKGIGQDLRKLIEAGELVEPVLQAAGSINDNLLHRAIIERFSQFEKRERELAVEALVGRVGSAVMLLEAIENKIVKPSELSATQARQMLALGDRALARRLEQVWGLTRPSSQDRLYVIKAWQRALDPSRTVQTNLANGKVQFQQSCGNCHKLFGEGRMLGPDLTGSNRKNLSYLLTNIIDPSAAVPVDFQLTNVLTVDGRVISGVVSQRSDQGVVIQTATETISIAHRDIEMIKGSAVSMMPDGLLDKLSEQQVRDLIAWIMSDGSL